MEQKKIDALMEKTKKALARIKVVEEYNRNFKQKKKSGDIFFIEESHKICKKLKKKIGDDAYYRLGCLCLDLAKEQPLAKELPGVYRTYKIQACNFFESAWQFNNGDPRAIAMLKDLFGLLEIPNADGTPYYFYLSPPQLGIPPKEPFELQGKYYREVSPLNHDHGSTLCYVTCNKSENGEMTYQLVTDWAERDALHKATW